jgi:hypothetical protein
MRTNPSKEKKLTKRQVEALRRIRDRGPGAWCDGDRTGGAVARMFHRMVDAGFCTRAPYTITDKGRETLTLLGLKP